MPDRLPLSRAGDWELKHKSQDIRGYPLRSADGQRLGKIETMIVNKDRRRVDAVVLDDDREVPAEDLRIADEAVYLKDGVAHAAADTVTMYDDGEVVERERVAYDEADYHAATPRFREHHGTTYGDTGRDFAYYEPAYRYGFESAYHDDYRERTFTEAESDLRTGYGGTPSSAPYDDVRGAVRYGYVDAQRGTRR